MIGFLLGLYPREKVAVLLELESTGTKFEEHAINKLSGFSVIHKGIFFFLDLCPRGKGLVLLELVSLKDVLSTKQTEISDEVRAVLSNTRGINLFSKYWKSCI